MSTTTTKAFRGAADLARWRAEARQRGRRPNVAYLGARFCGAYVDPLRRISGADRWHPGNRRKRIIRKMRRSAQTWRRLIRMGTALGHPIALSMNPLLQQLAEIEERRIIELRMEGISIGYSVNEAHDEWVDGRPVRVIDRVCLPSISPTRKLFTPLNRSSRSGHLSEHSRTIGGRIRGSEDERTTHTN